MNGKNGLALLQAFFKGMDTNLQRVRTALVFSCAIISYIFNLISTDVNMLIQTNQHGKHMCKI